MKNRFVAVNNFLKKNARTAQTQNQIAPSFLWVILWFFFSMVSIIIK